MTGGRGTGCRFNSSLVNYLGMFKWAKDNDHHAAVHHFLPSLPTRSLRLSLPC